MTLFAHYPEGCNGPPDDDGPHVIGFCANCANCVEDDDKHISVHDLLYCHTDCADEHSPCASTPDEYMSRAAWWAEAFWGVLLRCDQRWPSDLAQGLWLAVEDCIGEARDTRGDECATDRVRNEGAT